MKRLKRIRDTNLESDLKTQVIKHTADALASMSDEGRGRLQKCFGELREQALIRRCPNGATQHGETCVTGN